MRKDRLADTPRSARHFSIRLLGCLVTIGLLQPVMARASDSTGLLVASSETTSLPSTGWQPPPGILLAQADGDDAYDPFADYSEFEESTDEEEDINFFRNGRLLTLGFLGGYRGWTDILGSVYSGNVGFGLFISYFFDLNFAMQIGYLTSDHTMSISDVGFDPILGSVSISDLSFNLKYYFNTQNVTRGLADLNPYIIGGFSQVYRTTTISGVDTPSKDSGFAFDLGAGLEIPMMRKKMFFGGQAVYQLVNFPNEGQNVLDKNEVDTGIPLSGDSWILIGVLGINF